MELKRLESQVRLVGVGVRVALEDAVVKVGS